MSASLGVLVINGSSRDQSNTDVAIRKLCPFENYDVVDLRRLNIRHYSYHNSSPGDEFLALAQRLVNYEAVVFATPIYWYAMSGPMKVFFDRLTDLITTNKTVGRQLKGKKVYLIAQGSDPEIPEGFEVPFRRTSEYFDMEFCETYYLQINPHEIRS